MLVTTICRAGCEKITAENAFSPPLLPAGSVLSRIMALILFVTEFQACSDGSGILQGGQRPLGVVLLMKGEKLHRISLARDVTGLAWFCLSAWFLQDSCSPNYSRAKMLFRALNSVKFSAVSANENSSHRLSLKIRLQPQWDGTRALKLHQPK